MHCILHALETAPGFESRSSPLQTCAGAYAAALSLLRYQRDCRDLSFPRQNGVCEHHTCCVEISQSQPHRITTSQHILLPSFPGYLHPHRSTAPAQCGDLDELTHAQAVRPRLGCGTCATVFLNTTRCASSDSFSAPLIRRASRERQAASRSESNTIARGLPTAAQRLAAAERSCRTSQVQDEAMPKKHQ